MLYAVGDADGDDDDGGVDMATLLVVLISLMKVEVVSEDRGADDTTTLTSEDEGKEEGAQASLPNKILLAPLEESLTNRLLVTFPVVIRDANCECCWS